MSPLPLPSVVRPGAYRYRRDYGDSSKHFSFNVFAMERKSRGENGNQRGRSSVVVDPAAGTALGS